MTSKRETIARIVDPDAFAVDGSQHGQIKLAEFERPGNVQRAFAKADAILAALPEEGGDQLDRYREGVLRAFDALCPTCRGSATVSAEKRAMIEARPNK